MTLHLTHDEAVKAEAYQRVADRFRSDARFYIALAAEVEADPNLLTFAKPYRDLVARAYERLAEEILEAAYQAQIIADDYATPRGVA